MWLCCAAVLPIYEQYVNDVSWTNDFPRLLQFVPKFLQQIESVFDSWHGVVTGNLQRSEEIGLCQLLERLGVDDDFVFLLLA